MLELTARVPAHLAWLSQIIAGGSYRVNLLGGVMLTAFGLDLAFPTVSVAVTAGIPARQQGVAGGDVNA